MTQICVSKNIFEFINAKHQLGVLEGFNLSVAITDEFMEALANDDDFDLRFKGRTYKTVKATSLWETLIRSTWDWGEPGVIFIDRMNSLNNLYYCEEIATTNPCAEQPLPPEGACLLGSYNLTKYIVPNEVYDTAADGGYGPLVRDGWKFDYEQLYKDIPHVVRSLDNVIDRATYPTYEQEKEAKNKRRMGIGVTGAANAGEVLGYEYGSPEFIEWLDDILKNITVKCYLSSGDLAKEKGSFPLFNKRKYLKSSVIQSLPDEVHDSIRKNGIRNSHLISIAPTGTISQTADNLSTGIEPVFTLSQKRIIQEFGGAREEILEDYGYRTWGTVGKVCADVTCDEHIKVLTTAQRWCDSGVSKTCNVPSTLSWDAFKQVYLDAYAGGAKGCTTFTMNGKRAGILSDSGEI